MASLQTQKDKERFFIQLDRLDESDDEIAITSERQVSRCPGMGQISKNHGEHEQVSHQTPLTSIHHSTTKFEILDLKIMSAHPVRLNKTRTPCLGSKLNPSRRAKVNHDLELLPERQRIFSGFVFFFIPNNDIAKPRRTRIHSSLARGALWARLYSSAVTHVIVDSHLDIASAEKALPQEWRVHTCIFVRDSWLVESIIANVVQDFSQSRFRVKGNSNASVGVLLRPLIPKLPIIESTGYIEDPVRLESDLGNIIRDVQEIGHIISDVESETTTSFETTIPETSFEDDPELAQNVQEQGGQESKGFQCMEVNDGGTDNPNLKTIQLLQKMASYYDRTGDHWRTTAYRKAIAALRKQKKLISSKEEAIAIPQIGRRLAEKIEEIVTTSRLEKLDNVTREPREQALQLFMGIYGVGLSQANHWLDQGYRTLNDLRQHVRLSSSQKIGLEHYDDFQQRISRMEVAKHGQIVQQFLHEVDPHLDAIIGGSYRRGQNDSGDIDILITKRDANMGLIRSLVMKSVVPNLTRAGFLKVALATSTKDDRGSKWHGASCLPGHTVWRRIDLLFVPWTEFGAALIYFTGNDIFNRSLRLLAKRKGMKLTQHGLYTDGFSKRFNENGRPSGQLLEGQSEKKIFDILGVPWRPPEHRRC